jgi:hypothetical protein
MPLLSDEQIGLASPKRLLSDEDIGLDVRVPFSGATPAEEASLYNRQPAPEPSLTEKITGAFSKANSEPGAAFFGAVGKIGEKLGLLDEGEQRGERFGNALQDSLGPIGAEFVPVTGSKPIAPKLVQDARLQDKINKIEPPKQPISVGSKAATPTEMELHDGSQKLYKQLEESGVVVKPERFAGLIEDIGKDLSKGRLDTDIPLAMPNAKRVLSTLAAETGKQPSLANFQTYESLAEDLLSSANEAEARVGGIILKRLDEFQRTLSADRDLVGTGRVSPQQAYVVKKQADTLWSRYRKTKTLNELMNRSLNKAGANFNQAGLETALRQEYKNLANNPKERKWFSEQEMEGLLRVVRGDRWQKFVRNVGRFAPRGPVSGGIMGALGMSAPQLVIPAWVTAEVAKFASTRQTMRNVKDVRHMVATGGDTLKTLLSPEVHSHLSRNRRIAELMKRWAADGGSVNASRVLAVAIAKELNVPDLVPRIMQELQGTNQSQADDQ